MVKLRKNEFYKSIFLMQETGNDGVAEEAGNSTGAFRVAAISAECFEGFLAGIFVQQAFPLFRIELGGVELVPRFA